MRWDGAVLLHDPGKHLFHVVTLPVITWLLVVGLGTTFRFRGAGRRLNVGTLVAGALFVTAPLIAIPLRDAAAARIPTPDALVYPDNFSGMMSGDLRHSIDQEIRISVDGDALVELFENELGL